MAYYNGSANDMAAVRSALVNACVAEGWAWNAGTEVLSKGAMFVRIQIISGFLRLLGRTSADGGDMHHVLQMGPFELNVNPAPDMNWPLIYNIFVFDEEVYCVINYAVDVYQFCAFGQSFVQDLPGTGMWLGATAAGDMPAYEYGIYITPTAGYSDGGYGAYVCPALFWGTDLSPLAAAVHSGLDDQGWWLGQTASAANVGVRALEPLITVQPNAWNSEALLLPIRAYKMRDAGKVSLVADLENARYIRVDNYNPGQVISLGDDLWKVFPWFRKNSDIRDGGSSINHSGTFGWAIRYEGP